MTLIGGPAVVESTVIAKDAGIARRIREFITPDSVAIVGANEGNGFVRNLVKATSKLEFTLVNRRSTEVYGRPTVPTLDDAGDGIDLAVVSVPAASVTPTIAQGIDRGIRNYIIHAAGFGEAGPEGRARQAELLELARHHDVKFLGPNCLGFASYVHGVPLHGATLPAGLDAGTVGVIAQSGSASIVVMNSARAFGFSHIFSTGNEASVTSEDILEFMLVDDATHVILMFIESLRDGRRFLRLAEQARAAGKPIVALKVGRSAAGRRVAMSHTGAIAGSDEVYEVALRTAGVIQVFDFDEMIQTANVLATPRVGTRMRRPSVIGISGGELGLVADVADDLGVELPQFSEATRIELAGLMGGSTPDGVSNPLDFGNGYSPKTFETSFRSALSALERDQNVDGVVLIQDSQDSLEPGYRPFYRMVTEAFAGHPGDMPMLHISNLAEPHCEEIIAPLAARGILSLAGTRTALRAVGNVAAFARLGSQRESRENHLDAATERLRTDLESFVAGHRARSDLQYVAESDALSFIGSCGLPVAAEMTADSVEAAVSAAERIGYPVVIKIWSNTVVHKAAAGGVILNVRDAAAVRVAYTDIVEAVESDHPGAAKGVIVAQQLSGAVELILGAIEDETFGTFVLLGIGGGLVEALDRTSLLPLPVDRDHAESLISQSAIAPALAHLRIPASSIAETVLCFGRLAEASTGLLSECEINPLIVQRSGEHWAVDARMKLQ
ncbi:acetate--CoA ligase family protein [Leucobacter sp. HY1910]